MSYIYTDISSSYYNYSLCYLPVAYPSNIVIDQLNTTFTSQNVIKMIFSGKKRPAFSVIYVIESLKIIFQSVNIALEIFLLNVELCVLVDIRVRTTLITVYGVDGYVNSKTNGISTVIVISIILY